MRANVTLLDAGGQAHWLAVEWSGRATLGQLLAAAGTRTGPDPGIWVDHLCHGLATPLAGAGVRDGSMVSLVPPPRGTSEADDPAGRLHVAVTAGWSAGRVVALDGVVTVVGSDPSCDLVLDRAAGRHVALQRESDGSVWVEALGAEVGLDGAAVGQRTRLRPEQRLEVAGSVLELRAGSAPDAMADLVAGVCELRRAPRLRRPSSARVVAFPVEPEPPARVLVPWAATLAPLLIGVLLFVFLHSALMLLFVAMSPVVAVANVVTGRRNGRSGHRARVAAYREEEAAATDALAAAIAAERANRHDQAPDLALLAGQASGPRRRLWERRRHDDDFLALRLGLARLPSQVQRIVGAASPGRPGESVPLDGVPAVLNLAEVGVLGVAGPASFSGPVGAGLVAQAALSSGPSDLAIVVLSAEGAEDEARWGWTRWLPHTQPEQPGGPPRLGTTPETVEARVRELTELIEQRSGSGPDPAGARRPLRSTDWPHVLVVLDPAYDLRRQPGVDLILRHGPAVGVHVLCLEERETYLPVECRAVLTPEVDDAGAPALAPLTGPGGDAVLNVSGHQPLPGIRPDLVTREWCEWIGRSLAPFRDPEAQTAAGTIPTTVRLVDLLGLQRLDPTAVLERWTRAHRSTEAVVGLTAEGPFRLDLRLDGPHGLVAGTTGAGKSELLQTLIASLAVSNRHDGLNFLLVDYKGGSAFRDCANLPHTVGLVTDLDGHLTGRALESLGAELKRREDLLARAAAKDIDDYVAMGEPVGPLPRLLIVIDEFAGLVAELPDFVTGLVGIAQRGRSLGVHLILATQRPSGVVSAEIRANTNLRLALRVTSPAESADIIDAPDAARIMPSTPGRAYARTGHSSLTAFQAARVGGPATPADSDEGPEVAAAEMDWSRAGTAPALARAAGPVGAFDAADTDLARLARLLTQAARQSGVPLPSTPWLPPLPEVLRLDDLEATGAEHRADDDNDAVVAAPFACVDLPAQQRQDVVTFDPTTARHLAVAGGPGSGRTTLLRTLAVSVAARNRPSDQWLYAIDCGGGELRRLGLLPHTGAVVTRTEVERADRLLTRLHEEMHRRLERLAAAGFAAVAEQRAVAAPADRIPYILLMIDRWEGFISAFDAVDNQRLTDLVVALAREGGGAGIRLVVTGDRSVLSGRLAAAIDDRLLLNLPDRNDYAFAGFDLRKVPDALPPGRALRQGDGAEVQFAVGGSDPSGMSQAGAVAQLVGRWSEWRWPAPALRPFRIDTLPAEITEAELRALGAERPAPRPHTGLLAVGGDELAPVEVDLARSGSFVVAGPRRSGRSNTLLVLGRSLLTAGCSVLAFAPRSGPLRAVRHEPGVVGVFVGDEPPLAAVLDLINGIDGPLAVLVDDAMLLNTSPVAELLERIVTEGGEQGHVLVAAGIAEEMLRPMRGFVYQAVQARAGLLLCPERSTDGELVGLSLPRSSLFRHPPGRGVLVSGGRPAIVQVPLAASALAEG